MKPPVLTLEQQELAPPVVRMLIEEPVAFRHVAGVHIVKMEALIQRRAVISQLHHGPSKVWALVDRHLMRPCVLQEDCTYQLLLL